VSSYSDDLGAEDTDVWGEGLLSHYRKMPDGILKQDTILLSRVLPNSALTVMSRIISVDKASLNKP
jgi:hypothetical protein